MMQNTIEQEVRLLLGDLQLQLIVARARIAELEAQQAPVKPNGKGKSDEPHGDVKPGRRPGPAVDPTA
jgi:hypothetical protein